MLDGARFGGGAKAFPSLVANLKYNIVMFMARKAIMRAFAFCVLSGLHALMFVYSSPEKPVAMSATDDIVTPIPALALPGVTLDDIKDCYLGCHFTGTAISETGRE